MKYRYFAQDIEIVKEQFFNNYGEENILFAKEQDEFEEVLTKCKDHDFLDNYYSAVLFDTFLFFNLLTENNIYFLKSLEKNFDYIVFCGKNIEELAKRMKNHV